MVEERGPREVDGMTVCHQTFSGKVEMQLSLNYFGRRGSIRGGGKAICLTGQQLKRDWITSVIFWDVLNSSSVRER